MTPAPRVIGLLVAVLSLTACSRAATDARRSGSASSDAVLPTTAHEWARDARIFDDGSGFHRAISSSSTQAQRYFDQGMRFMWAFNHDEAARSFARAAELDPNCAICLWGLALSVNPDDSTPTMEEPRARVAFESLRLASEHRTSASPVEQALVGALRVRYPQSTGVDAPHAAAVLEAYARAMRDAARQFPQDDDVQTIYAESLMDMKGWKLWQVDGAPAPGTDEIIAALERVLARDPTHPGANHYYIHALEASPHPERAFEAAGRLHEMKFTVGHPPTELLPLSARPDPVEYLRMYSAHNFQNLAYSSAMQGRRADALEAMRRLRVLLPEQALLASPGMDWHGAQPYVVMVRFGLWDQLLAEPRPNPSLQMMTGGYLFARATALAASGRVDEARQTLAELQSVQNTLPDSAMAGLNGASDVLTLAATIARSRIELAEHHEETAVATLRRAVMQEDRLNFQEPADWCLPVRHLLGDALMKAGQFEQAEAVYREDLQRHPDNGWALFGLSEALRMQAKHADAAEVEKRFQVAWKNADFALYGSAM